MENGRCTLRDSVCSRGWRLMGRVAAAYRTVEGPDFRSLPGALREAHLEVYEVTRQAYMGHVEVCRGLLPEGEGM